MKKLILIFVSLFCVCSITHSQNIIGKWKCSEGFLKQFGLPYSYQEGKVRFKKDGTFKIKAKIMYPKGHKVANDRDNRHRRVGIEAKGFYVIENGTISTTIKPDGVKCNIDTGMSFPDIEESEGERHSGSRRAAYLERNYYGAENAARAQEKVVVKGGVDLLQWNNEPVTVTKDSLIIGDKATFIR